MIMNTAVAVAVTELFVISREAVLPFIAFGTMPKVEGLEKRLGLVSWQKSDVLDSSQPCGIAGRSWSQSRLKPKTECLGLVS